MGEAIDMRAVMYGAGNIGRGFVGALFSQSGYEVTFIDVALPVVERLNADGRYPVRILSGDGHQDIWVGPVNAVNGRDQSAVAEAIAEADIMATAVGVNVMKLIAGAVAEGLKLRFQRGARPLNIIICENLLDADKVFRSLLEQHMDERERMLLHERIGLVEASIGRMVPVQTPEMQDGHPLRVCVERYGFLPVDAAAFAGEPPAIRGMVPYSPFDFYIRRKLYVHNMGHATCAYLGLYAKREYIYESIDDAEVRLICQSAMTESAVALSKAYGADIAALMAHVNDLLMRFENRALRDTCARVGNDTRRKLAATDRLIGAAALCQKQGVVPSYIAVGAAAGLYAHLAQSGLPQTREAAMHALSELAELPEGHQLTGLILKMHALLAAGTPIAQIRRAADKLRATESGDVI